MKTVIGLFKDREEAIRTIDDLERVGANHDDISVLSQEATDDLGGIHLDAMMIPGMGQLAAGGPLTTFLHTGAAESAPDMLAATLVRMGIPRDEAVRYVEGVRQGYTLETVAIDDDHAAEALEVMRAHAMPSDFDRGDATRGEGLGATGAIGAGTGGLDQDIGRGLRGDVAQDPKQSIPIVEDELDVGKRQASGGGVRVKTHAEERPVEEKVDLREERVDVERRAVNRPATAGDEQEKTIELTATTERPVVRKRARGIEEIVLSKDVRHRTETVRDTVRRTEADVQQLDEGDLDQTFREHYDRELAGGLREDDYDYDTVRPAYKFGSTMRSDRRFQGDRWEDIEPNARSTWEQKNPGTWEKMKLAVRHAWERTKS